MLVLTRTVRFAINSAPPDPSRADAPPTNSFAAYPTMAGLGRHYELEIRCRGTPDPHTGYFLNIKAIDAAARAAAIPVIQDACRTSPNADPIDVLRRFLAPLNQLVDDHLESARWRLSPYHSVEMSLASANSPRPVALLRQQFELAAAHRLHIPSLTDQENREMFGKCNNPLGHGHNYRIEPCVAVPAGEARARFSLLDLERITQDTIVNRFDHTHLNHTPEFDAERGGLNPSVENIAKVFFDLLAPAIARHSREHGGEGGKGGELRSVTVWETDKTGCTYPA